MGGSATNLRSSCSFPNLLLSCLSFTLFLLSATSIAPVILLRSAPTSLGLALLTVSSISLASSFVGFYAQLTHFCFTTHLSLILAAVLGQLLSVLALFFRESSSLSMLKPRRDPREAKLLVRLECGLLTAMLVVQVTVLVLASLVQRCWVRDYEGLEAEKKAMAKKRSWRMAQVQDESMANVAKIVEVKDKEFDEKMKKKYGQWVKSGFEG